MKLSKTYTPDSYEPNIYALWEESGAFKPTGKGTPYSVLMPPPNANGNLHIGHALDMNLKDILTRYKRMNGFDTIFLPGEDHAGFETWVVYEKELQRKKQSRFDFSREQLYSQIWNFVDERRGDMELQLRALGVSASWDDLVFTLDEKVIKTVHDTFKKMWDDKLIYRGKRIVNYCTTHHTSFADIEVNHKTEKGKLWKIAYPTLDKIDEIVVATTRPETMLGDTAVAVHPDDERYKHLVGSTVLLPLTDREIPVIADEYVDRDYGTGAVKITPAHDPNDFEVGKRHNLDEIQVIDYNDTMINVPPQFAGYSSLEARKRIIAALKAAELLRGEGSIEHAVGHCYKCGSVIQPLLMDQWFINVKPLAEKAIDTISRENITFYPSSKAREIVTYLENLNDWNLSRQIPWGIPIPAFQNVQNPDDWIFDERVDQETIVVNGTTYKREEDTFDTWFSSGQWPYVTTDYLDDGELARFYPISLMETGSDLLRQWVSRMIMLGVYRTGKAPFKTVYMHGMVNDEHNQKMSKSKGNVINPMEKIAQYGSDALRLGIMANRSAAQNQAFSEGALIAGRNFCNKLWNIARYVENTLGQNYVLEGPVPHSLADHWIAERLDAAAKTVAEQLDQYRFSEASETVYQTVWNDVADWYIEASKQQQNPDMLAWVLSTTLRLAHPFAPFVTETIWQTLPWYESMLISQQWPTTLEYDAISAAEFERLKSLVSEIRFVTNELPGNKKYRVLYGDDSLIEDNVKVITHLAQVSSLEHVDQARGLRLANSGRDAWIDIDAETLYEHQSNLEVRLHEARKQQNTLHQRLKNKAYVEKAPEKLVEETKQNLVSKTELITRLENELAVLQA